MSIGSNASLSTTFRRFWNGSLGSNDSSLSSLGSLICNHLLVHSLEVQVLQVHVGRVLDEISSQKLEALVVSAEEHSIVLISLLEGLDGLNSDGLHPFLCSLELLVLLQGWLPLRPQVIRQDLRLLPDSIDILQGYVNGLLQNLKGRSNFQNHIKREKMKSKFHKCINWMSLWT